MLLIEEHARFEQASFEPSKDMLERLKKAMEGAYPKLYIHIARCENRALGYCALLPEFSTWSAKIYLHMDCLFVREEARGLQIGKQLMRSAVACAKAQDIDEVQWQTPDWNERAVRFYEGQGAKSTIKKRFILKL